MDPVRPSARRGLRRSAACLAVALVSFAAAGGAAAGGAAAGGAAGEAGTPEVRSFDVVLAPVCLEGAFPVTLEGAGDPVSATLRVTTDPRGAVTGTFEVGAARIPLAGTARQDRRASRFAAVARLGADRLTFSGTYRADDRSIRGTVRGRGTVAPGRRAFRVDVSAAPALVASLDCTTTEGAGGFVTGTARVVAAGDTLDLAVGGRVRRGVTTLSLRSGRTFTFTGSGPAGAADLVLAWSARGFGATARGGGLDAEILDPPTAPEFAADELVFETESAIDPILPTAGAAPRGAFVVQPPLPVGLTLDAATGAISGTPTEVRTATTYTVSATNWAGSRQGTVRFRTKLPRRKSFETDARPRTDDDRRHFLLRTQFGVTQAAMDRLTASGEDAFLDSMLTFSMAGPAEAVAAPELANGTDPPGYAGRFPSQTQLARWWSSLMMSTDNPFQERLAFFWHDHFAASSDVLDASESHFMTDYVNLLRAEGNGNLRSLLVKVARDPCMLKYLDGYVNTAARPNENFAREFWELFSLGVDNGYTQADIVEAARAFTGWKRTTISVPNHVPPLNAQDYTSYATMTFDRALFDPTAKTLFGSYTIPAQVRASATDDYQQVVDLTLDHRPVAEFVVTKLFEHFVAEDPAPELVTEMAAHLRSQNHEIAPFLRQLFRCEAFYAPEARRALVKNPVEFGIGFVHTTGLRITVPSLQGSLTNLGQVPTQPPTVNGWPLGELWLSSQNMADRINLVYACVEDTTRQRSVGIEVANVLPPAGQRSAANVVDHLAALLRVDLTPAERQACIDFVQTTVTGTATSPVGTIDRNFSLDATTQTLLDQRVRGLLYVLAQHPSYQIR